MTMLGCGVSVRYLRVLMAVSDWSERGKYRLRAAKSRESTGSQMIKRDVIAEDLDVLDFVGRAASQPGPLAGGGHGRGRSHGGVVEDTTTLWVGWVVAAARVAGVAVPRVLAVNDRLLGLVSVPLTWGRRWFFLCPICGRRVEAVFFLRGGAACRRCHRLLYRSQCHRTTSAYRVLGRMLAANGREDVNETLLCGLVDAFRVVMVREPVRMSLAEKGGGDAAE
mgnify:CR=1 FL=1